MFGELLRFTAPPKFRLDPSEDLKSLIIPPWVNLRISNLSACDRSTPGNNKDSATCCWTFRLNLLAGNQKLPSIVAKHGRVRTSKPPKSEPLTQPTP